MQLNVVCRFRHEQDEPSTITQVSCVAKGVSEEQEGPKNNIQLLSGFMGLQIRENRAILGGN